MNKPEIQNVPFDYSIFSSENRNCILSTVKKAEKDDALIIRVYNPDDKKSTNFDIIYHDDIKNVSLVKFDEETIMDNIDFSFTKNKIKINEVKTCQALSIRIE